jgi:23S rRNA pseudouridine2605 synthase
MDARVKPAHDELENMPKNDTKSGKHLRRPASAARQPAKSAERIAKVMARAGLCSRRDAEEWIAAGRVAVNGAAISSPALNVRPSDNITVDGEPLPQRERTRLFLYHKPRGLVTTHADPQGRPTIFGALPKRLPRLISVGRLDFNTEGLLLLTNDGGLARTLELPQTGWLRRYRVRALGRVTQGALHALHGGVTIGGLRYGPIEAALDREQGANVWLTVGIREGKNREVRNVMEHLGLKVNRLIRVSFGPFQLGELSEGAVEEVPTRTLREQLGERLATLAGADFAGPISVMPPLEGKVAERSEAGWGDRKRERTVSPTRPVSSATLAQPGRDKKARPTQADDKAKRITRSGIIADRRGRKIPVTRTHTEKPERPARPPHRHKRRPDRSRGPRPSRPR